MQQKQVALREKNAAVSARASSERMRETCQQQRDLALCAQQVDMQGAALVPNLLLMKYLTYCTHTCRFRRNSSTPLSTSSDAGEPEGDT
jgi:hypothetical protein